jgi:hypothetical protein
MCRKLLVPCFICGRAPSVEKNTFEWSETKEASDSLVVRTYASEMDLVAGGIV